MKNKVFFLFIFFFTIIYGTSCEKNTNNYTTELTFENLEGQWEAKNNDNNIKWIFFKSENELSVTRQYYDHRRQSDYTYQLDTTGNILMSPDITIPNFVCPIKFVSTRRIIIEDFPTCSGEDITFTRD